MNSTLSSFSNAFADVVDAVAPSVVQVHGRRRPASGVVFRDGVVVTTGRALGHENGVRVRTPDGRSLEAELAGWDPATHVCVLRVADLNVPAIALADAPARIGHLAVAIGRSWSNAITATIGNIAVIGGPLPTGRGQSIDQIIRTTAPMHSGFAGGAFADTNGKLLGLATAAEIRGFGVVIPAAIVAKAANEILEHGQVKRGYLGLAGQSVRLGENQRGPDGPETALLVVGLTAGSPAAQAGLLIGDIVTTFDGIAIDSVDRLLEVLVGDRVGRAVSLRVLRGGQPIDVSVTVGERGRT